MYLSSGRSSLIWTVACLLALCATGHPLHIREGEKEIPSGQLGLFMEIPEDVDVGSKLEIKIKIRNLLKEDIHVVRDPWGILQEDETEDIGDALQWLNKREPKYTGKVQKPPENWLQDWVNTKNLTDDKSSKRVWHLKKDEELKYVYKAGKVYDFSEKGIGRFFYGLKRSTLFIITNGKAPTETRISEVRYDVFVKSDEKEEEEEKK